MSATSSVFGRADHLTPLLEIDIRDVTEKEAQAYDGFLQAYNQYWRMYFDPIAVRVKVTPKQLRLETVVLPLIDNSIYTSLAQSLGGEPVALDGLPVPSKAIHTVSVHLNKQPILEMLKDVLPLPDDQPAAPTNPMTSRAQAVRDLVIAMHNYHSDYAKMPARAIYSKDKKPLLSWRVQLLPYLEQDQLYKQFKLDEPWDSEHNKKLIEKMPAIFRGSNAELNKQFKTRYVVPVGTETIFPPDGKQLTLGQITVADGTSNTIALLEASDEQAVIWTKPDDWELDVKNPTKGLFNEGQDHLLVGFCDGVVRRIPARIPPQDLAHLVTYKDGIRVDTSRFQELRGDNARLRRGDIPPDLFGLDPRKVHEFLVKGIGDQASFHVLDASFPLSTELSGFIGSRTPLAEFGPMRMGIFEMASFAMIAQSLTHPFCIMIPVKDAKIVDDFLNEIDKRFAQDWSHELDRFVHIEQYQVKMGDKQVRIYAIKILGITLRFCWCRAGDVLMIANQTQVLEETMAKAKADEKQMIGHAMFRVRPERWNAVLADYRLGWEENQRAACVVNETRIANVARAWPELLGPDGTVTPELLNEVHRIYGVKPFCPDGGNYQVHALNQLGLRQNLRQVFRRPRNEEQRSVEADHFDCECSIHGTPNAPRQLLAPTEESATAKTLSTFGGLKATLTFMEDGLHGVVVIDRK
jgi:hypothetical protein